MTRSDRIVARPSRALRMATRLGGDAIMSDGSGAGVRECFGNAELSTRAGAAWHVLVRGTENRGQVAVFSQFPDNSQSLNPYSYILNNPLSGTDPTGYACVAATGSKIKTCETVTVTTTTTSGVTTTASRQMNAGTVARAAAANGATGGNRSDGNRQDATKAISAKGTGGENNVNRGSTEPPRWGSMSDEQADQMISGMSQSVARTFVQPVDSIASGIEDARDGNFAGAMLGVFSSKARKGTKAAGHADGAIDWIAEQLRKIPNPWGKKGGPEYQAKVAQVADEIRARGLDPVQELRVPTPNGAKPYRFVDVSGVDPTTRKVVERHQVGRQTQGRIPVSRERRALDDIESINVPRPTFHPYNDVP